MSSPDGAQRNPGWFCLCAPRIALRSIRATKSSRFSRPSAPPTPQRHQASRRSRRYRNRCISGTKRSCWKPDFDNTLCEAAFCGWAKARLLSCQGDAEPRQFGRIALAPCGWSKEISDLDAPAGIERVFIEPAKTDRCARLFFDDDPGSAADAPALPLMRGEIAPAGAQRRLRYRVLHRRRVAEKVKQRRSVGQTRWPEQQARGFERHPSSLRLAGANLKPANACRVSVARMERSAIRVGSAFAPPRITLRTIRATRYRFSPPSLPPTAQTRRRSRLRRAD